MADNAIGDEGAIKLAEALALNGSLTSLELERNHIQDKGTTSLAYTLRRSKLRTLNLRSNGIGATGAIDLAVMLSYNTALTDLALSFNDIGNEGGMKLAEGLKHNTTLLELDICEAGLGGKSKACLREAASDGLYIELVVGSRPATRGGRGSRPVTRGDLEINLENEEL